MAAHARCASRDRQRIGMSTRQWASWCTWTSRSWAASGRSANACSVPAGHRSIGIGWQYAHVAVDDHSRLAHVELRPTQQAVDCLAFTRSLITAYADHGTPIQRILTDNGSCYRSTDFTDLLAKNGIRHIRTNPYTPRTNGKAEAFIRTLQREWAYAHIYPTSSHRAKALPGWLRWYNNHRPHGGIGGHPPQSRVSHAAGSYI